MPAAGTDLVMVERGGVLHKATAAEIAAIGGSGIALGPHDFWQETWFSANGATSPDRWTGAAISSGTNSTAIPAGSISGKFRHGVFLRSSTTANGGYRYQTSSLVGDVFGQVSHKFIASFRWLTAFTGRTVRIGFHDSATSADATDGAYFEIVDATCSAKTANNGTRTTNATTLTLSLDIPYVFHVDVNAAGTEARFRVFNGKTGASLMDVTNTTNIPTSTARSFGSGIVATEVSTTASDIGILYALGEGTVEGYLVSQAGSKGDKGDTGAPGDPGPAGGPWTQIGSSVSTASGTAWAFTSIPPTYSDLLFVIGGFSTNGGSQPTIQISDNDGANYSNAFPFSGFSSDPDAVYDGGIIIHNYNDPSGLLSGATGISAGNRSISATYTVNAGWRADAGIDAVRISTAGGNTGDAGAITLYGR